MNLSKMILLSIHFAYHSKLHRKDLLNSIFRDIQLDQHSLKKYIHWNNSKQYTRNRIKTDGKNYDLLVLCWNPGQESKIHDHPGDGCYVKVISGRVQESIYNKKTLELKDSTIVNVGSVSFIDDSMGLHKLGNPDSVNGAITLHLYTPPTSTCTVSHFNF